MADRRDYYFKQTVTEAELDAGFEGLEQADFDQLVDWKFQGITLGMTVTEHAPQDVTVDVAAGSAYDQAGQRIRVPALQNIDVSQDLNGVSTAVVSSGNEKIVSVYVKFARALSDPRTDGNNQTVFFVRDETFAFVVRQGTEATAGTAVAPALQSDELLVCDITRKFNDNTIANADIDATTRRENLQIGQASPQTLAIISALLTTGAWTHAAALNLTGAVTVFGTGSLTTLAGAAALFGGSAEFDGTAQFDGTSTFNGVPTFNAAAAMLAGMLANRAEANPPNPLFERTITRTQTKFLLFEAYAGTNTAFRIYADTPNRMIEFVFNGAYDSGGLLDPDVGANNMTLFRLGGAGGAQLSVNSWNSPVSADRNPATPDSRLYLDADGTSISMDGNDAGYLINSGGDQQTAHCGAELGSATAAQEYGSAMNFPSKWISAPTVFNYSNISQNNNTTPAPNGVSTRGALISSTASAGGDTHFSGVMTIS